MLHLRRRGHQREERLCCSSRQRDRTVEDASGERGTRASGTATRVRAVSRTSRDLVYERRVRVGRAAGGARPAFADSGGVSNLRPVFEWIEAWRVPRRRPPPSRTSAPSNSSASCVNVSGPPRLLRTPIPASTAVVGHGGSCRRHVASSAARSCFRTVAARIDSRSAICWLFRPTLISSSTSASPRFATTSMSMKSGTA